MMRILIMIAKCVVVIWLYIFAKISHMDSIQLHTVMALIMPTTMFALLAPFYLSKEVEAMPDLLGWAIKIAIVAVYAAAICITISKIGSAPFQRVIIGIGVLETIFAGYLASSTTKPDTTPNNSEQPGQ